MTVTEAFQFSNKETSLFIEVIVENEEFIKFILDSIGLKPKFSSDKFWKFEFWKVMVVKYPSKIAA